jgi:hypothetical protein
MITYVLFKVTKVGKKNFVKIILSIIFLVSCSCDNSKHQILFNDEDFLLIESLMEQQITLMEKIKNIKDVRIKNWEVKNNTFILNSTNLENNSLNMDSTLSSWNLSKIDYDKLKENGLKLSTFGICSSFPEFGTYCFMYNCEVSGFDVKSKCILIKKYIYNYKKLREYGTLRVLDEYKSLILVY